MVDFDKFEKLAKQKYGEQEFPFDEANWEKARTMIDASRKGKNRGGIWLLSAAAVLCTTGLVYYFVYSSGNDAINKNKVAVNEPLKNELPVNSGHTENLKNPENTPVSNENQPGLNGTADHSNSVSSENKPLKNTRSHQGTDHNTPATGISENTISKSSVSEITDSGANSNAGNKAEPKNNSSSGTDSNTAKSSEEKAKQNSSKNPAQQKSVAKTKLPEVLGSNTNQNNTKPYSNSNENTTPANNNKIGVFDNKSSTANTPGAEKNSIVTDSAQELAVNEALPVTESILKDSSENITQLPADSFKISSPKAETKGDGISYATNVKLEHEHKNFLYMEAGASYLLGWNAGSTNEAGGFNVVAGLNFQHYFSSNIFAQIGLQYNTIGNLSNSTHTITSKNYDLGLQQNVTTITYQKLYYAVAPIKVGVTFRKNNHVGVGCNVGYLMNTDSKIEKYTTYSSAPGATKNNLSSTKEKGYMQGFAPFDIQVSAFYRRKIYAGFSANAEFIYGLKDIKDNSFFNTGSFDRNIGFKLTLCYDLFKK